MFLFTHKLCTLFQTLKIRCYDRMTIYPLCTAADFTLCPLFRGGAVVKGWKWFALLPIKIKRCHCQFATDQTRTSSQSLVRRGEEGLQEMERKYVCLFISSPSPFSPGQNLCQVYLQSSAWGSWELQLARSSQSGAQHSPYHRCVLLPSALRWTFSSALGEAKLRRTQEKHILEKVCASKSIDTLCLHCYLSFRLHWNNTFLILFMHAWIFMCLQIWTVNSFRGPRAWI